MARYFLEVAYMGTHYSGFQVQENASSIQSEIENAFQILHRRPVRLTGSSRTDAGVHALQNYFHFDEETVNPQFVYKMNAILPPDVVIKQLTLMPAEAHSRFDAIGREYEYHLYRFKNPFLRDRAYYYPYKLDRDALHAAAAIVKEHQNFFAFAKTNTQVKTFQCTIYKSEWVERGDTLLYNVAGNRFLRGMVRLLAATMLQVGRGKLTLEQFRTFFKEGNEQKCSFSLPAHGLFLKRVVYPENFLPAASKPFSSF